MTGIESPIPRFVGRAQALKRLEAFSTEKGPDFRWLSLVGASGMGKTRLAIEWLQTQRFRGWDVGIVDPSDYLKMEGWEARRPTALVIDDTAKNWGESIGEALYNLYKGARPGRGVQVLVTDQIAPWIICVEGERREQIAKGEISRPFRLTGFNAEELQALRNDAGIRAAEDSTKISDIDITTLQKESGGRPRAALLLLRKQASQPSYEAAMTQWADQFLPELANEAVYINVDRIVPLALAALAGPVPTRVAHQICQNIDPVALTRFFEDISANDLSQTLPPLEPDELAEEILLRALQRLDAESGKALINAAIAANPGAVEQHLGSMWTRSTERRGSTRYEDRTDQLLDLQNHFDRLAPERVGAFTHRVDTCLSAILSAIEANTGHLLVDTITELVILAARRPFDSSICLAQVSALSNAVTHFGSVECWDDLELWGARLNSLADDPRFSDNPLFRHYQAIGAYNTMLSYGHAQRLDALERWGATLTRTSDHPQLQFFEAGAAADAIAIYGALQRWDDLERWGVRLKYLADEIRLPDNLEILLQDARGATNAIFNYGQARHWDDLERWGARLTHLADDQRCSGNSRIRVYEGEGVVNATLHYGLAQRWDDLERWEAKFNKFVNDPLFSSDPEIRWTEAKSAYNATRYYGAAQRWDDLERWGAKLLSLADDPRFCDNLEIRILVSNAARNSIFYYGSAQRFDDLERWGARLTHLADDQRFSGNSRIRILEASAGVNASRGYGSALLWDEFERWGTRLNDLANNPHFSGDAEIQLQEASFAYNAITYYGVAQLWDDLERWGGKLFGLTDIAQFSDNLEIGIVKTMAAVNAILFYDRAANDMTIAGRKWRSRLALACLAFPENLRIQQLATPIGLNYAAQAKEGFPYGPPEPRTQA